MLTNCYSHRRGSLCVGGVMVAATLSLVSAPAQAESEDVASVRSDLERLRQDIADKQQTLEQLQQQLEGLSAGHGSALDRAVESTANEASLLATPAAKQTAADQPSARLIDLSLNASFSAGCSSEEDETIELLQGGAHDPKRCGFNFQAAELSLSGAVDPYLYGEAHILFSEGHVEVEEAFAVTTALPWGLELKGGYFLTEFGRINPTHPHAWRWIDQPLVNSRLLGEEGLRGAGVRLGWLAPTPWYSQLMLGAQNADDSSMISFRGEGHSHGNGDDHGHDHAHGHGLEESSLGGVGGSATTTSEVEGADDLLYLVRWESAFNPSASMTAQWGVSGLFGPNRSGEDSRTQIYGTDLVVKWLPANNFRGTPSVTWQTELMWRDYEVGAFVGEDEQYNATDLKDRGLYTQLLYQFHPNWAAGLRYEYAGADGALPILARQDDPQRSNRTRIAPLLAWMPSHFAKLRLQYNYDEADFLDESAHSLWLGLEFLIGSHPAHTF